MAGDATEDLTGIGELQALLGRGAGFEGKLSFEGRVRIDGQLRGEVFSDGILILGPSADVDAVIDVGTLIVRGGRLRGEVVARHSVELHAPARVVGTIRTRQIYIDKGAVLDGECKMLEGERPLPVEVGVDQAEGSAPGAPADGGELAPGEVRSGGVEGERSR
ncbi:MAG: polymer-forming cytoskeletal protein [Myxococcales bacterium]|nr:polymer-forming cytoskeletal protein [Myxococcales bacterium]